MAIRVLHIVTYMGRGGLETMIMNYYRHIDRNKVQFDFLVHRDFEADYDEEILKLGGEIHHLPKLNPFSPSYYKALDKFFAENRYDIVHSHLDCLSAYPLRSAKKYGVRVRIAHAHNKNQDRNLKYIIKMVSKVLMPFYATHLFACSSEAGRWMFPGKKFTVMNNAIDSRKYVYSPEREQNSRKKLGVEGKFIVGHVGRFNPQKNNNFLIDIFSEVSKRQSDAILLLIGTGDGQPQIVEKVKELGLQEQVMFLGNRSDVPELLQAMDVFAFPSLYEGLGIAAVEAQAAGVPCILSDQVPQECKMTEDVEFLSLNDSAELWAEHILQYRCVKKKDTSESICNAGYDIVNNAEWLQKFYLSGGKNE